MNRRHFLKASTATLGLAAHPSWTSLLHAQSLSASPASRLLMVYADKRLGSLGAQLTERTISTANRMPLLAALCDGKPPVRLNVDLPQAQLQPQLAYNHILLFALADDPLLQQVWQREASIQGNTIHVFGFGTLRGTLGYIESDRNPFLHAAAVPKAPYECEAIAITGTNVDGVQAAADAFLSKSLVNGVVAPHGAWSRTAPSLLDRDPLPAPFEPPSNVPDRFESLDRIAWTQTSEDVYRRILEDAGEMPVSVWQAKYYTPGQWDEAGLVSSFRNYAKGLHRRAYGNMILAATFANAITASAAAPQIAKAAQVPGDGPVFSGHLPPFAWGLPKEDSPAPGSLKIWSEGTSVYVASVVPIAPVSS